MNNIINIDELKATIKATIKEEFTTLLDSLKNVNATNPQNNMEVSELLQNIQNINEKLKSIENFIQNSL